MAFESHTFIGIIYFIIFVLGICGNGLVLAVLINDSQTWKVSFCYLVNLAAADLLFVTFLPFWGHYQFNQMTWIFGPGMCRFCGAITFINMYASIFFLVAMSLDRWAAVVKATKCVQRNGKIFTSSVCAGVWVASIIFSIPSFMYRILVPKADRSKNETTSINSTEMDEYSASSTSLPYITMSTNSIEATPKSCQLYFPASNPNKLKIMAALELFQTFVGFIIPFIIISFCYVSILNTIKHKVIGAEEKKLRVVKLVAVIITAFFVCWAPFHALNIYSALGGWLKLFPADGATYITLKPIFICLAYANSCINPILYAFTSGSFQESLKKCLFGANENDPRCLTVKQETRVENHCRTQITGFNTASKHSRSASHDHGSTPQNRWSCKKKVLANHS